LGTVSTPLDTAWKIHAAQVDWTGKVDSKASFAFTISSAALATTVALSADGRTFSRLSERWEQLAFWSGIALALAGALFALIVVVPRLRHRNVESEAPTNYIYFGHLRLWTAEMLVEELTKGDPMPVVARQSVIMAAIAWRKHLWVQRAMACTGGGIGLLVITGLSANL